MQRALYRNPDVLILDEATSALDNMTEKGVIQNINKLGSNKTIVMVAHRLSSLSGCNKIINMENGRVREKLVTKSWLINFIN